MRDRTRRRRRGRRPLRRGIYVLPSLLTTGNLFAGYYSIVSTLHGEYRAAALAIGIAFVIDGLDGRIARLTRTQSEFGKAYDSIADVVTFGAAPAALALSWGLWDLGRVGWLASFFYLACAAMRLARFSIHSGSVDRRFFVGLPSPASAGLLAALSFYWPHKLVAMAAARVFLLLVLATAALMVSPVRYRSFKEFDLRRRQPYTVVLLLAMVIALIALDPEHVLLLLALTYALSGPAERAWLRARRRGRDAARPATISGGHDGGG